MKMRNLYYALYATACMTLVSSCGILGGKKNKGGALPNDGQVHGVAPGGKYSLPKPPGMVYVPQGTFHMGPSDEDPAYAFSAKYTDANLLADALIKIAMGILSTPGDARLIKSTRYIGVA